MTTSPRDRARGRGSNGVGAVEAGNMDGVLGTGAADVGVEDALALVDAAEKELHRSQQEKLQDQHAADERRQRVMQLLLSAMDMARSEQTTESVALLEQALEAAKQAGVPADLRVRARKALKSLEKDERRAKAVEAEIGRLTQLLDKLSKPFDPALVGVDPQATNEDGEEDTDWEANWEVSARRVRAEQVIQQLKQAIAGAIANRNDVDPEKISEAKKTMARLEKDWRAEEKAERKLRDLLAVEDADTLEDRLTLARERHEDVGPGARRVAEELEDRYTMLVKREQRDRWLKQELTMAAVHQDKVRLRQLVDQAKTMDLTVAPNFLTLLHQLESPTPTPGAKAAQAKAQDHLEKLRAHAQRAREASEQVVMHAEQTIGLEELSQAKQAIVAAKEAKVPQDVVLGFQRRIARLELKHGPRLEAEEALNKLLKAVDPAQGLSDDCVIQDPMKVDQLRAAIEEARARGVHAGVVERANKIFTRSMDLESQRRAAEETLSSFLAKPPARTEAEFEQLERAVEEARRCGIATLHAERELQRQRAAQVHREAAEAELQEASKGEGAVGRARLEAAIKDARCSGVNSKDLRAANARMAELERHEKQCALLAGNLRRALLNVRSEPWRVQQLLESAKDMQPWTPELERLILSGQQQLDKTVVVQKSQREAQQHLQVLLEELEAVRVGSQTSGQEKPGFVGQVAANLQELLPRARSLGVKEELVREGERQLKALKREGCQRQVAEHRLRLAMCAKDYAEIERAVREVRALGTNAAAASEAPVSGPSSARGRQEGSQSSRLMDAASSMLRQLGDAAQRRQAAATALLVQISDQGHGRGFDAVGKPPPPDGSSAGMKVAAADGGRRGLDVWLKEVDQVVKEAQQSGVAPSLIEHAKMKVREKRRQEKEKEKALHELQSTLHKKNVPRQELLRNLQKVQRLSGAAA